MKQKSVEWRSRNVSRACLYLLACFEVRRGEGKNANPLLTLWLWFFNFYHLLNFANDPRFLLIIKLWYSCLKIIF